MNTSPKNLLSQPVKIIAVWIVLLLSTLGASLWVKDMVVIPRSVIAAIIVLGAFKVSLVISYYMEINHAPTWLKFLCGTWVILVFSMILLCYCT